MANLWASLTAQKNVLVRQRTCIVIFGRHPLENCTESSTPQACNSGALTSWCASRVKRRAALAAVRAKVRRFTGAAKRRLVLGGICSIAVSLQKKRAQSIGGTFFAPFPNWSVTCGPHAVRIPVQVDVPGVIPFDVRKVVATVQQVSSLSTSSDQPWLRVTIAAFRIRAQGVVVLVLVHRGLLRCPLHTMRQHARL